MLDEETLLNNLTRAWTEGWDACTVWTKKVHLQFKFEKDDEQVDIDVFPDNQKFPPAEREAMKALGLRYNVASYRCEMKINNAEKLKDLITFTKKILYDQFQIKEKWEIKYRYYFYNPPLFRKKPKPPANIEDNTTLRDLV